MRYSNARKKAVVEDWPIGGSCRGKAVFEVEANSRGERCSRITEKRNGSWGKPKRSVYGKLVRIVDGEDGRTYVAILSKNYPQIGVMRGDMKYSQESFHHGDDDYDVMVRMLYGGRE